MIRKIRMLLLMTFVVAAAASFGQNSNDARDVTQTYYIKNAFVVEKPGRVLPATSVVIKDGLITNVGKGASVPFDAKVINADSMYVYAAFIDAATHTGIPKKEKEEREDVKDPGNPTMAQAGITPQHKASELIDFKSKDIKSARDAGFGYLHVLPRGRMMPGKSAIITTGEGGAESMILSDEVAAYNQLRSARGVAPATIIGVMSKYRDIYKNAELLTKHKSTYTRNPLGLKRPGASKELAALAPVVNKQMPVFFSAQKVRSIYRVLTLKKELGFNTILTDVKQANLITSKIRSLESPVLVSLDLPKKIEDEKKDDDKSDKKDDAKKGVDKKEVEEKKEEAKQDKKKEEKDPLKEAFDKRKMEAYDRYESQAADLVKAGVKIGFTTLSAKSKDVKENILRMIAKGLTADQALAALTTDAASITGLSQVAGSVEKGKLGNVFITDKPYFEEKSKIKYTIVDGKLYENKEKKKKKKDSTGEKVDISGKWTYTLEIPGQETNGTMMITADGDSYEVKLDSSDEPGDFLDATNVDVSGGNLTFDLSVPNDGFNLDLSADMDFDGESFEGTMSIPQFGSFPVTGSKMDGPKK